MSCGGALVIAFPPTDGATAFPLEFEQTESHNYSFPLVFRVHYKVKATSSIFSLSTVSLFANQVVSTHLKLGHLSTNVSTVKGASVCNWWVKLVESNYLSWRQLVCVSTLIMILERSCRVCVLHWKDVKAAFCVITREDGSENK